MNTDMMARNNAVVAIYKSHTEAETAIKELPQSAFHMKTLSIVGRDQHTDGRRAGCDCVLMNLAARAWRKRKRMAKTRSPYANNTQTAITTCHHVISIP
jgi:hypothetical protein